MSHLELFSLPEALLESSLACLEVSEAVHCVRTSRFLAKEAAPVLNRLSILWGRRRYKRLWEASFRSVQTSNNKELPPYAALMIMLGQERILLEAVARISSISTEFTAASSASVIPVISNELAKWCSPKPHALLLLHAFSEGTTAASDAHMAVAPFRAWFDKNGGSDSIVEMLRSAPFVWHLATTEATVAKWRCLLEEGGDLGNSAGATTTPATPGSPADARRAIVEAAVAEADAGNTSEDVLVAALRLVEQKGGIGEGMALLAAWRDPSAGMGTLQPVVAEIASRCWRQLGLVSLRESIEPPPLPPCARTGAWRPALSPPHHFPWLVKQQGGVRAIASLQEASHAQGTLAILRCVAFVLFQELGFRGAIDDEYYDPRNSFLDQVLLLRRGIPISLAGVFSLCCSAVGLRQPLMATNLPFHFLLAVRLSASDKSEGDAWASEQPEARAASEAAATAAAATHAAGAAGAGEPAAVSTSNDDERTVFIDAYSQGKMLTGGQALDMVALRGMPPRPEFLCPGNRCEVWRRCLRNLQGIYRAPGPSRSIDNLRLYGVLSQTIVLCSNDGSDSEGTGAERECLEARARRLNYVQNFAFSVAASDLACLSSMTERAAANDDEDDDSNNQIAIVRSKLVEQALNGASAIRNFVATERLNENGKGSIGSAEANGEGTSGAAAEGGPVLTVPEGRHATKEEVMEAAKVIETTAWAALWKRNGEA